jgi:hypothetical protein
MNTLPNWSAFQPRYTATAIKTGSKAPRSQTETGMEGGANA